MSAYVPNIMWALGNVIYNYLYIYMSTIHITLLLVRYRVTPGDPYTVE